MMSYSGYSGSSYDRFVERGNVEHSTINKMQQQFWVTKQAVIRKLGRKEDESVVASDAELDAKIELFKTIDISSRHLSKLIDRYQEKLCVLAQEENALGRFLKEYGKVDKTRAGSMMSCVGKTMSYSAQQRLSLRVPLSRLHQEVDTFHNRAVLDTQQTVNAMEKSRTEYRGALMWMKNVSQELDPDTYKQLDKFRKVQNQVKKSKDQFDDKKVASMQKIDLLAASRSNMFSHALILYQNTLLHFMEKTSKTMTQVSDSFKGYQYFEFSVIKELSESAKVLALQTSQQEGIRDGTKSIKEPENNSEEINLLVDNPSDLHVTPDLLGLGRELDYQLNNLQLNPRPQSDSEEQPSSEDMKLLEEILSIPSQKPNEEGVFSKDSEVGANAPSSTQNINDIFGFTMDSNSYICPSQLLSLPPDFNSLSTSDLDPSNASRQDSSQKSDWFNIFADLDPLGNPDTVGKKTTEDERNC